MRSVERELIRVDLDPEFVQRAKDKLGEDAEFRETVDYAVEKLLPEVERLLDQAGFVGAGSPKPRVRPFTHGVLEKLDAAAERHGVSRVALLRALLTLMGREKA